MGWKLAELPDSEVSNQQQDVQVARRNKQSHAGSIQGSVLVDMFVTGLG